MCGYSVFGACGLRQVDLSLTLDKKKIHVHPNVHPPKNKKKIKKKTKTKKNQKDGTAQRT